MKIENGKIFIRKRRKVKDDEKKPRFRVVAVAGAGVSFKADYLRKTEIEQIAEAVGAEVVYLKVGINRVVAEDYGEEYGDEDFGELR